MRISDWSSDVCSSDLGRSHKLLAHKGCPDLHQSTSATNAAPPRPRSRALIEMFTYYLNLALRSFRRNKALTALMVLAIALGIGASMTTLTVFHVLSGDPVPSRSGELFYVQLDPEGMGGYTAGEEPAEQVTRFDAETLLREKRGDRQAMMTGGSIAITPQKQGMSPFYADARYATADIFPMFDMPFLYGGGWSATEDERPRSEAH